MISTLNHVAVLVESIESVLEKNIFDSSMIEEIEEFPSEGTRELYIGQSNQMGKLLLMQENGLGPYQNALTKRGPGLHHIAIDVSSIDDFVSTLSGSGWFLHPRSLEFYTSINQVWLSRPGVPVLVEVNERKIFVDDEYYIDELGFPFEERRLWQSLRCSRLKMGDEIEMFIDGKVILITDLLGKTFK